jgi:hypothetical protein
MDIGNESRYSNRLVIPIPDKVLVSIRNKSHQTDHEQQDDLNVKG